MQGRRGHEPQLPLVRGVVRQDVQRRGRVGRRGARRAQRLQARVRQQRARPRQAAPAQRHPHHRETLLPVKLIRLYMFGEKIKPSIPCFHRLGNGVIVTWQAQSQA